MEAQPGNNLTSLKKERGGKFKGTRTDIDIRKFLYRPDLGVNLLTT